MRADEGQARGFANLSEVGIFGQEAVTGMDGIGAGDFGCAHYMRNVQVALAGAWRANADGLVGEAHVKGVPVGFGIDGHGLNAQLFAGADDA